MEQSVHGLLYLLRVFFFFRNYDVIRTSYILYYNVAPGIVLKKFRSSPLQIHSVAICDHVKWTCFHFIPVNPILIISRFDFTLYFFCDAQIEVYVNSCNQNSRYNDCYTSLCEGIIFNVSLQYNTSSRAYTHILYTESFFLLLSMFNIYV